MSDAPGDGLFDAPIKPGGAIVAREEVSPIAHPGELLTAIIGLAKDPDFDVSKLQALMGMQERLEDRQAERAFARALHDAQAEIPSIAKNGTVTLGSGKGSYAFATWEDMDKVLRPVMDRHGFTLSFDMAMRPGDGGGAIITGTLMHSDGHSKSAAIPLALDAGPGRNSLQAMGSTMSYGRRYVTEMLFNLVRKGVDDDGVSGGAKFITSEQAAELQELIKGSGRSETDFMQSFSAGTLHHFDELEPGTAFLAAKGALTRMARTKGGS